ncbi:MAG: hypothetical protein V3V67_08525 [Myxococcota bacterium]
MNQTLAAAAGLLVLLGAATSRAQTIAVGTTLASFSLVDQYGKPHQVDAEVTAILFTREMGGGDVVKEALAKTKGDLLAQAGVVYVADVSRMPAIIRRVFAIPSLRRRGYPILLDTKGSATKDFPSAEGSATLLVLQRLRVSSIVHIDAPADLEAALQNLLDAARRET